MSDGPKLYTNKPKKGPLKAKAKEFSSPSSNPSSLSHSPSMDRSPTPPPPKESFARRYKFVWPILLTVNLAIGAFLFMRTNKKEQDAEGGEVAEETSAAAGSSTALVTEKPSLIFPITEPVKMRPPIPEDKQRQIFKWILEEKRKIKPQNSSEKKGIDEEKAILKQYIRAKSVPSL